MGIACSVRSMGGTFCVVCETASFVAAMQRGEGLCAHLFKKKTRRRAVRLTRRFRHGGKHFN